MTPRKGSVSVRWFCACLLVTAAAFPAAGDEPSRANAPLSSAEAKACQQAWAGHLGKPVRVTNSIGMEFQLIPPGTFKMGSPQDEEWHRPDEILHPVTITKAFYMAKTEVNQGQWKALMGENPSFFEGDALPVETVTWEDAAKFCRKLSDKEGIQYRLPTEAEWEYACRAGTITPFHSGETISTDRANYDGNHTYANGRKGIFRETTTKAGSFPPNAWGVCDMHGNVWEWCADWYGDYPQGEVSDPTGPASGDRRISRGGCWINFPAVCRSANRAKVVPLSWNFHTGFRVVRVVD